MKEYLEKAVLYKKIAEMEEMARNWYLDTPWDSPAKIRYQSCLQERERFKHMIADFPTASIEDVLGIDYDLNRLRELVEADRDGRCVVLPDRQHTSEDGENALKSAMNTCYYHNNRVTRYIADAVAEKLTREAAEAALKKED